MLTPPPFPLLPHEDRDMLPELAEHQATGTIAQIYDDIRILCAVPYVSSLQRHLATRPGWLEWAWAAMSPVFADGSAQTTAWQVAAKLDMPPLPVLSRPALRVLGVDADGEQAIRTVCESFVRVSPTNLMFSGILRHLLGGTRPSGAGVTRDTWTPPATLPPLPSLVDFAQLTTDARAVLMQLGTEVAGQLFVPGLYRMLAHWPAYLAHVATVLGPRFDDPATQACCQSFLQRLDAAVPSVVERLPALPETPPMPPREQFDRILETLERYRETSPQMVVFGTLLRDALPAG
jgi:hypothetical protein